MKCKNCGATLDEGALFCRRCGTAAPQEPEPQKRALHKPVVPEKLRQRFGQGIAWIKERFAALKQARIRINKRFLLFGGVTLALLIVLIVVIASAASCRGKTRTVFDTSDEAIAAAIEALEHGDGERLWKMTGTSEALFGAHPELFGEGDTPEAVMKAYYTQLADGFYTRMAERYGRDFTLTPQITTTSKTGTEIFEPNRALGIEADEYVTATGYFSVDGEIAADVEVCLITAHLDGGWKLIAVYVYDV